jgi:hypothetical protein
LIAFFTCCNGDRKLRFGLDPLHSIGLDL